MSKVPQSRAPNGERMRGNNIFRTKKMVEVSEHAALRGDRGEETFAGKKNVGVPFSDVSFRAFTASPNVEKGTPTDQPFDNRSIA